METQSVEKLLLEIEELKNRLAEAEQLIDAIKAGEVDAFALTKDDKPEIFTLQSGDYAYRVLVENFSEGALNLSEEGLIVYTNASFYETLNISYEKVIGKSIFDFVHPESKAVFVDLLRKGFKGQSKGEVNLVVGKKIFPVYVSLKTLSPSLPTVGMIVTDLTEKKHTEKELESKKMLQDFFMKAPFALCVFEGEDCVVSLLNEMCCAVMDKNENEAIGKNLFDLVPRTVALGFSKIINTIFNTRQPYYGNEYPVNYFIYGEEYNRYFDFVFQPKFDTANNVTGIIAIAIDVSDKVIARKKIEKSAIENSLLAAIVHSSEDAIIGKTLDGIITNWNPGAQKLFGFTAEEMIGQSVTKIIPKDRLSEEPAILSRLEKGEVVEHFHTKRMAKNGDLLDISLTISPIRDNEGKIVGASKIARDITKEKQVQEKLNSTKDQLELSISAGNIGIWNLNLNSNHLQWSKQQCEIYGIAENEFEQTLDAFWKFVHPEDRLQLQEDAEEILKIRKSELVQQFRITRADGTERWIESRSRTQYNSQGEPEFNTGINIDITSEKLFSRELEAKVSERTLELTRQKDFNETIINSTPDLITAYDPECRFIVFNKACEDFFSIKQADVIGKVYTDLFPKAKGKQGHKDLLSALNGETIHNAVYHSPVTGKFYENYISPLRDECGKIYAAVAIAHDITDYLHAGEQIRQSEEKFKALFSAAPLGLVLSEIPSGKIVDVNEIYCETIGYTKQECINKTSLELNLVDGNDRQKIVDELEKNGFVKSASVDIRTKSGKIMPVLNSIETIFIGDKKYLLSAIIDITERRNAERKMEEKNIELQNVNKELEAFNYISSHDLQEPLRKIQIFAGRIIATEKEQLSETAKGYFNRMNEAAVRMQTLIQDLLRFSSLANTEHKFEIIELTKIINEVRKDFKETLEEKNATILTGHMCEVNLIPFQFRQLLENLIGNSLKFSRPGIEPEIEITSKIIDAAYLNLPYRDNGNWCHIIYTDNGIGFEAHYSEKIFQVFQRLHSKEEYSGTGIGLAIVKKIIDNHNGKISATSEPGKGARFDIYIPAGDTITAN